MHATDPFAAAIRVLLYMEWDPLGLNRSKEAWQGQYDVYVQTVSRLAQEGRTAEDIAAYLDFIESSVMARLTPPGRSLTVARMVLQLATVAGRC